MLKRSEYRDSVAELISVPKHIAAIAGAVAYDLLNGPIYTRKLADWSEFDGDNVATWGEDLEGEGEVIEVYGEPADQLRAFIAELPSALYYDQDSGCLMESEPEGEFLDGDGEPCEADSEGAEYHEPAPYYALGASDIVAALFGETIAKHFN